MAQTVIGLFENESDAQRAVQNLVEVGISRDQVDIARGTGRDNVSTGNTRDESDGRDNENGITRFFKSLFGDSEDAERYSRVGNSGYSVVTVHAQDDSDATRAADILDECGAVDVDERAAGYSNERQSVSGDFNASTQGTGFPSDDIRTDNVRGNRDNEATISRVEEELHVGKRQVESGGARLRSRIVERPVEESIRLREEHVRVERQNVDRPVTDSDRNVFQDQDIELIERAEVPVVNKEARVVEEVTISKDVTERTETVRDTVRNTEVDIDKLDGDNSLGRGNDTDQDFDRNRNNL
jgi:stress response protein YsnF